MVRIRENTAQYAGLFLGLLAALTFTQAAMARGEWYRGLDLESAARASDLILVARVTEVSETKMVSGGKAEYTMQQIKFEPVHTLKGVFTRDALLLTTEDLGGFDESANLERGQVRLLLLGRSGRGYTNHNRQGGLDSSVPPLQGGNDPLLGSVKVLIGVTQQHDRARKVALLLDALRDTRGASAIPLLLALQRRALLAAQTVGAPAVIARHLADASPAVREAATSVMHTLLDGDYLEQKELRGSAAAALVALLERRDLNFSLRVAALDALGATGTAVLAHPAAAAQLNPDKPRDTFAERAAVVRAIGQVRLKADRGAVATLLEGLPLDAPNDLQKTAVTTLIILDADQAAKLLMARLRRKLALALTVEEEIGLLAELPKALAAPALLAVAQLDLGPSEQFAFAQAATRAPDPRLTPALATMLSPRRPAMRASAFEALRRIDTEEAAKAMLPHLKEEADLARKLQIAEFLGRHGMRDGYPYAMEHLSEPGLVEEAVAALVAIRDPKTMPVLRDILKTSNDTSWNSVAIRALGALGVKEFATPFLEIVQDLKNPLAPAALVALGGLGETKALQKVREGLASRNHRIALASARASAKLLAVQDVKADELRAELAALLADADAHIHLRQAALDALVAVNDPRLVQALRAAVRDGRLEGSELMVRTERLLRERKVKL